MKTTDKYSERLSLLELHGFVKTKGCITNGKYSFLYTKIDESDITDEQFMDFINIVKSEQITEKKSKT